MAEKSSDALATASKSFDDDLDSTEAVHEYIDPIEVCARHYNGCISNHRRKVRARCAGLWRQLGCGYSGECAPRRIHIGAGMHFQALHDQHICQPHLSRLYTTRSESDQIGSHALRFVIPLLWHVHAHPCAYTPIQGQRIPCTPAHLWV